MIKSKAVVCAILFLFIMACGALLHSRMEQDRQRAYIRPPDAYGDYRIQENERHYNHSRYLPREYVRITRQAGETKTQ